MDPIPDLINTCWIFAHVPVKWNMLVAAPVYEKGNRDK
jgi:hypothetical protein